MNRKPTRKRWLLALLPLVAVLFLLMGCSQWGNGRVSNAIVRDNMFSVEKRNNGVTTVWLRNDESGVYCFTDNVATFSSLKEMLESDKMVTITYSDARLFSNHPCSGAESSYEGSGFHTFIASDIHY